MEDLSIIGTEKTPFFNLTGSGEMAFGGISMPEDAAEFYFTIIDWISDYYRDPAATTHLSVTFKYLNSTSASMVNKIFHTFNRLHQTGKTKVTCDWYYETHDHDMLDYIETVMDLAENIDVTIHAKDNILEF